MVGTAPEWRFCRCFTSREVYLLGRRSPRSGCFPYAGPNSAVYAARHDGNNGYFATFLNMAGIPLPEGVTLDGMDQTPMLWEQRESSRDEMYYWRGSIYWQFVKVLGRFISVPLPILIPGMLFGNARKFLSYIMWKKIFLNNMRFRKNILK